MVRQPRSGTASVVRRFFEGASPREGVRTKDSFKVKVDDGIETQTVKLEVKNAFGRVASKDFTITWPRRSGAAEDDPDQPVRLSHGKTVEEAHVPETEPESPRPA